MILFSDNARSNSETRTNNITALRNNGFREGCLPCRSGEMQLVEKATKVQLVFGLRSNISGKGHNKYFSLSRDFSSKDEAKQFLATISLQKR